MNMKNNIVTALDTATNLTQEVREMFGKVLANPEQFPLIQDFAEGAANAEKLVSLCAELALSAEEVEEILADFWRQAQKILTEQGFGGLAVNSATLYSVMEMGFCWCSGVEKPFTEMPTLFKEGARVIALGAAGFGQEGLKMSEEDFVLRWRLRRFMRSVASEGGQHPCLRVELPLLPYPIGAKNGYLVWWLPDGKPLSWFCFRDWDTERQQELRSVMLRLLAGE